MESVAPGQTRRWYAAHTCFEEALAPGHKTGAFESIVRALCRLEGRSPRAAAEALSALGELEAHVASTARLGARYLLWKATGKHEHLAEVKRLLDYRIEHAPEEYRESMLKNVRLNREILEACAEHGEKGVSRMVR